jgi:hypothetical protein
VRYPRDLLGNAPLALEDMTFSLREVVFSHGRFLPCPIRLEVVVSTVAGATRPIAFSIVESSGFDTSGLPLIAKGASY